MRAWTQNFCETNYSISAKNTVFACAIVCVSTHTSTILLLHIYIICVSIYTHAHSVDIFPYSHIHKTVDDTSPIKPVISTLQVKSVKINGSSHTMC